MATPDQGEDTIRASAAERDPSLINEDDPFLMEPLCKPYLRVSPAPSSDPSAAPQKDHQAQDLDSQVPNERHYGITPRPFAEYLISTGLPRSEWKSPFDRKVLSDQEVESLIRLIEAEEVHEMVTKPSASESLAGTIRRLASEKADPSKRTITQADLDTVEDMLEGRYFKEIQYLYDQTDEFFVAPMQEIESEVCSQVFETWKAQRGASLARLTADFHFHIPERVNAVLSRVTGLLKSEMNTMPRFKDPSRPASRFGKWCHPTVLLLLNRWVLAAVLVFYHTQHAEDVSDLEDEEEDQDMDDEEAEEQDELNELATNPVGAVVLRVMRTLPSDRSFAAQGTAPNSPSLEDVLTIFLEQDGSRVGSSVPSDQQQQQQQPQFVFAPPTTEIALPAYLSSSQLPVPRAFQYQSGPSYLTIRFGSVSLFPNPLSSTSSARIVEGQASRSFTRPRRSHVFTPIPVGTTFADIFPAPSFPVRSATDPFLPQAQEPQAAAPIQGEDPLPPLPPLLPDDEELRLAGLAMEDGSQPVEPTALKSLDSEDPSGKCPERSAPTPRAPERIAVPSLPEVHESHLPESEEPLGANTRKTRSQTSAPSERTRGTPVTRSPSKRVKKSAHQASAPQHPEQSSRSKASTENCSAAASARPKVSASKEKPSTPTPSASSSRPRRTPREKK